MGLAQATGTCLKTPLLLLQSQEYPGGCAGIAKLLVP